MRFLKGWRSLASPLSRFFCSCLSGKFVEQAPSDESDSPPKITMSLSTNSVGDEKFLPKPPSYTLS